MLNDPAPRLAGGAPPAALSALFLAGLPEARRAELFADAGLEESLRGVWTRAQSLGPAASVGPFLSFIGRILCPRMRSCEELGQLRLRELFLVFGYGRGDPAAQEIIEQEYLPEIERSLRSYALSDLDRGDIRQMLRQRLWASLVPQPGSAPYSGRGELLGWLRVMAIREARHTVQRHRRASHLLWREAAGSERLVEGVDQQLLKAQYLHGLRQAFGAAMEALSPRDRELLHDTYINNQSIDALAVLYKVHRATVARWIRRARKALRRQIRRSLQQQPGLSGVNPNEIVQLVGSQLDVSMRPRLAAD